MSQSDYYKVSGFVFLIVDVMHCVRIYKDISVQVAGFSLPMWISYVVVLFVSILAAYSFKFASINKYN